jgi:NADH dehydrogenase
MNILVAGGTGFIGKRLVRQLLDGGHKVLLMQRPSSKEQISPQNNLEIVRLDPQREIVAKNITADAVINLAGIIREFPSKGITYHRAHVEVARNLVDFAGRAGIPRFLQMSALGVKPDSAGGYMRSKFDAEQYIQKSALKWTIFRPSVVYGPDDHIVALFSSMIRKLPIVGVVGDGRYKLQPLHVDDVCAGFVRALTDDRAMGRTFEFGGPDVMTFDQMLDAIGEAIGIKPVRKFHVPVKLLLPVAAILKWHKAFPITPEQINLLIAGSYTFDDSYYDFVGRKPIAFKDGLSRFLQPARRL